MLSAFLRVRRGLASGAGNATVMGAPSSSPAALAGLRRRRVGLVRFGSSGATERLGGGASTAGGAARLTGAIAREGSG
ncbi:MAG: hypothetical protein WA814_00415, partial [Candidatus Baltobacteraceae bacterium]